MAERKQKRQTFKRLEMKLAAKKRKERIILTVVGMVIGIAVLAVVVGIIISNMIKDGRSDGLVTYVDYWDESQEMLDANERVVATCNGIEIPYEALRYHTMHQKFLMEQAHGEGIWDKASTAEPLREELEAAVAKSLQNDYMILSACYKLGINTEQKAVIEQVNAKMRQLWEGTQMEFENGLYGAENYASAAEMYAANLEDLYLSEEQLRTNYKIWSFLPQLILYTMEEFGHFPYTLSNLDEFIAYVMGQTDGEDHYVHVIHLMTDDEAKAESLYEELFSIEDPVAREARMHELIGQNYYEGAENVTRDGFYFTRGEMQQSYEDTAYGLEIGEVSAPVAVADGYCVMMRLSVEESYVVEKSATLLVNYQNVIMDQYIESYRKDCAITYNDYGKSIDLVAMR